MDELHLHFVSFNKNIKIKYDSKILLLAFYKISKHASLSLIPYGFTFAMVFKKERFARMSNIYVKCLYIFR